MVGKETSICLLVLWCLQGVAGWISHPWVGPTSHITWQIHRDKSNGIPSKVKISFTIFRRGKQHIFLIEWTFHFWLNQRLFYSIVILILYLLHLANGSFDSSVVNHISKWYFLLFWPAATLAEEILDTAHSIAAEVAATVARSLPLHWVTNLCIVAHTEVVTHLVCEVLFIFIRFHWLVFVTLAHSERIITVHLHIPDVQSVRFWLRYYIQADLLKWL